MEENSNSEENKKEYKQVNSYSEKKKSSFGKSFALPFFSGILGTTLVIGTCFGIPQIKEKLIGSTIVNTSSQSNSPASTAAPISLTEYSETSTYVASKVLPSIVGITIEYSVTSPFAMNLTQNAKATGSGIIISEDGYILTNNHVVSSSSSSSFYSVSEATKITVNLYNDNTEYEAKIIGTDSVTDLAVIKIEKSGLTAATLGNSDATKVGEFSMAVGNPLGMQSSITCGVISALNRKVKDSDGKEYTLIQTDTAINSGNSGGALVNANGEVIGINNLKIFGNGVEGMGFAIPINIAKPIYEQLIQYNKVKRPYIGITGIDIDDSTASRYQLVVGVYVKSVEDFSAAQKAGIKAGDVITKIDGTEIKTMNELNNIKNSHNIGDEVTLTIHRDNSDTEIKVTLEEQP